MTKQHKATEQISFEEALARLPAAEAHAKTLLTRLHKLTPIPTAATIVDIGAAQGRFLIACAKQGYKAVGVEPWDQARTVAARLARHEGVSISILSGVAEAVPLPSRQFDVVHAASVVEHVRDAQTAFDEAHRILKPGGVFWFATASSICPRQEEIRGFPLFAWYPDRLKRRIMAWAERHRPNLIGWTHAPAINWFTPWKARRMLRRAGFRCVYDRWDLPRPADMGMAYRIVLRAIRASGATKLLADILVPGCSYAAVK